MRSVLRKASQGPAWFRRNTTRKSLKEKYNTPELIRLGTRFPWSFVQGKPGEGDWLDL